MDKILSIELYGVFKQQKLVPEVFIQISIYLFFEYLNTNANYPKMELIINEWKFEKKPQTRAFVV